MIKTPKGTKIKKCPHGYGLFAIRNFKKGQLIGFIIGGKCINRSDKASFYSLKIPGKNIWWDELTLEGPKWDSFLDHNNECNSRILFKKFNPLKPKAKMIAIKNIKTNEEITINYHEYGDKLYKHRRYKLPLLKP